MSVHSFLVGTPPLTHSLVRVITKGAHGKVIHHQEIPHNDTFPHPNSYYHYCYTFGYERMSQQTLSCFKHSCPLEMRSRPREISHLRSIERPTREGAGQGRVGQEHRLAWSFVWFHLSIFISPQTSTSLSEVGRTCSRCSKVSRKAHQPHKQDENLITVGHHC